MKNCLALIAGLALLLSSPGSFATHQGAWHGDNASGQSSGARCQMEENSGAYGFVPTLLHGLFHDH